MLHVTCVQCGAEVSYAYERGPKRKLCFSPECRRQWATKEARRRDHERRAEAGTPIDYRNCSECGRLFVVNLLKDRGLPRVVCSSRCRNRRIKRQKGPERVLADKRRYNESRPNAWSRLSESRKQSIREAVRRRRAWKNGLRTERFTNREIYERDKWVCQLCRRRVKPTLAYPHPLSASLDHIMPRSRGGDHVRANVQLAHLACNLEKRDRVLGDGEQLRLIG